MASNKLNVRINNRLFLSMLIYLNRSKLIDSSSFQVPITSNNSIITLKSNILRLYLSNVDMSNLFEEIKNDLIFILYDLPNLFDTILSKVRVGKVLDFEFDIIMKYFPNLVNDNIAQLSIKYITRINKKKFKLVFAKNWKLEIIIEDFKKLQIIGYHLLFNVNDISILNNSSNRILTIEHQAVDSTEFEPIILQEDEDNTDDLMVIEDPNIDETNKKPEVTVRYKAMVNAGSCLSIYVLERPRRHKQRKQTTTEQDQEIPTAIET